MGFWILGIFRADRVKSYVTQQCLKASADLLLNATPADFFAHSLHTSPNLKNLSLYLTVVLGIGISLARGLYPAGKSVFVWSRASIKGEAHEP